MPLSDISEPAKLNFTIVRGDSFTKTVIVQESDGTPIDLTGYVGRAEIRQGYGGTLLDSFTVAIPTPSNGEVTMSLDATQTVSAISGGVYDLELDAGVNNRHTLLAGTVTILPDVTVTP